MNESEKETIQKLMRECIDRLGEHCDSVRIFVTVPTHDGQSNTAALDDGSGNFYAQMGQIHEWIRIQDQYQRNWAARNEG